MTQSISPVSSSNAQSTTSIDESPKSWWDTIVSFIFAEDQQTEPAEPLKDKKIMEIDPDTLRQKRLVEEAVAAQREREKRIAAEKAAHKPPAPTPEAKPAAPAPNPEAKPAAPAPKPEAKPAAPAPKPEAKPAAPAPKPEAKPAAPAPKPEAKPAAPALKPEAKPAAPAPKPEAKPAAPAPKPAVPAPKPEAKPAAPAPKPEAKPAAPAPKPEAKPTAPKPGVAVDAKMRQIAQSRLNRLSSRLATVRERLASLEETRAIYEQKVHGLETEEQNTSKILRPLKRGSRHRKHRQELNEKVAEYRKEIAAFNAQIAVSTSKEAKLKVEQNEINAAITAAQRVVDLLKNERVMPQQLEDLQKAAEKAELALTRV